MVENKHCDRSAVRRRRFRTFVTGTIITLQQQSDPLYVIYRQVMDHWSSMQLISFSVRWTNGLMHISIFGLPFQLVFSEINRPLLFMHAIRAIIRLEARFQPNVVFILRRVLAVTRLAIYNFAESEPIRIKSGALWVLDGGWSWQILGRDPRSSKSWRVRRNFVFLSGE